MSEPTHLAGSRNGRGFHHLPPIVGPYGTSVRVYESSAAESPHVWIRAEGRDPDTDDGTGVHLTAEQAWQLKEQIEHLLANHYQGNARPKRTDSPAEPVVELDIVLPGQKGGDPVDLVGTIEVQERTDSPATDPEYRATRRGCRCGCGEDHNPEPEPDEAQGAGDDCEGTCDFGWTHSHTLGDHAYADPDHADRWVVDGSRPNVIALVRPGEVPDHIGEIECRGSTPETADIVAALNRSCPYIATADDGSHHCRLAEFCKDGGTHRGSVLSLRHQRDDALRELGLLQEAIRAMAGQNLVNIADVGAAVGVAINRALMGGS